jgi:hypothetical protein
MNIMQARAIMDAQLSPHPPPYGDWRVAGQVIANFYARHPEKLRVFTTDGSGPSGMRNRPGRRTSDQPPVRYQPFEPTKSREAGSREWLTEQSRGVKLDESWATVVGPEAPNPGMITGADLVQTLPGDASSYFISVDPKTRKAAVYRYRQPQQNAGAVARSNGTMARTMDRDAAYYRGLARQAEVQRELAAPVLKSINAANQRFWQGAKG